MPKIKAEKKSRNHAEVAKQGRLRTLVVFNLYLWPVVKNFKSGRDNTCR